MILSSSGPGCPAKPRCPHPKTDAYKLFRASADLSSAKTPSRALGAQSGSSSAGSSFGPLRKRERVGSFF